MTWITASILMFISSVALYLGIRKSNDLKTPQQLNNLAMFLIPALVYLFLDVNSKEQFAFTPIVYLIIFVQAIFFSYLGNVFSLKGINEAPNPGYSLIISRSYVVFTSIASVFLFGALLTAKSIFAIFLILSFSTLIMIDKTKNKEKSNNKWLGYTIGAFFCAGFSALSSKYLLMLGVPILARLIYSMIIATMVIMIEIGIKKIPVFSVSKQQVLVLLLIGIFGASFVYFMQVGFDLAPNVGYINAINAGSISLLTLSSAIIFKDELNIKKIVGIFGVTAGLLLLFL